MRHRSLLAAAVAAAAIGWQSTANTAYTERQDAQRKEHETAQAKKKRIREQIRARKAIKGGV